MQKSLSKIYGLVFVFSAVYFALLVWLYRLNCYHLFDFGIGTEALSRIRPWDLSPYVRGWNISLLCDHFDPIYILVAPFSLIIPTPILGIFTEFAAILLCWFPLQLLYKRGFFSERTACFAFAFIALNRATIDALSYTFHPTTWAILPLVCVFTFYILNEHKKLLLSLIFLFACKEEFPFLGLFMGLLLIIEKKKKAGAAVLLTSVFWLAGVFLIRPNFCPLVTAHGPRLVENFLQNPLGVFTGNLKSNLLGLWGFRLLPLLLLIPLEKIKKHKVHLAKILFIGVPTLAIRFLAVKWEFHYGTAAMIILLFCALPLLNEGIKIKWRYTAAFIVLFCFATLFMIKDNYAKITGPTCSHTLNRISAIQEAQEWIKNSNKNVILVEGNLSTQVMLQNQKKEVFLMGRGQETHVLAPKYDVVFVEKPQGGDPWPLTHSRILELISLWKADPLIHVIYDNDSVFLAEGLITLDR